METYRKKLGSGNSERVSLGRRISCGRGGEGEGEGEREREGVSGIRRGERDREGVSGMRRGGVGEREQGRQRRRERNGGGRDRGREELEKVSTKSDLFSVFS